MRRQSESVRPTSLVCRRSRAVSFMLPRFHSDRLPAVGPEPTKK